MSHRIGNGIVGPIRQKKTLARGACGGGVDWSTFGWIGFTIGYFFYQKCSLNFLFSVEESVVRVET